MRNLIITTSTDYYKKYAFFVIMYFSKNELIHYID